MPLLRMQNGGFEEQLIDNINGFDLGPPSPLVSNMQIDLVQNMRNIEQLPSERLFAMCASAKSHGKRFMDLNYTNWLLFD